MKDRPDQDESEVKRDRQTLGSLLDEIDFRPLGRRIKLKAARPTPKLRRHRYRISQRTQEQE